MSIMKGLHVILIMLPPAIQSDFNGTITTYYIAISADPSDPPIDDPNFYIMCISLE
ncbi:MAG: hypothetical protein R2771_15820 [Saprospiraceae bacterium]